MRAVKFGSDTYVLDGDPPSIGDALSLKFLLPSALTNGAIADVNFTKGFVIVSTLPKVHTDAATKHILEVETYVRKFLPESTKVYHVSPDTRLNWRAAHDLLAGFPLRAYTLYDSAPESAAAFKNQFGINIKGFQRIPYGLFALIHGKFSAIVIADGTTAPNVTNFLKEILDTRFP